MADQKYERLILREPRGMGAMPPRKPTQVQAASINEQLLSEIPEVNCNFNFMGVLAPHLLGDPPHSHDYDEFLFFIATDPENAPDLGGEVEIAFGEDWEKQVINTSAIVCLPKGVQHCPIYVKRVDRPFYFGHIMLATKYSSSAMTPE